MSYSPYFEHSTGIEPIYPGYKSGASPFMLRVHLFSWFQNCKQNHGYLQFLGEISSLNLLDWWVSIPLPRSYQDRHLTIDIQSNFILLDNVFLYDIYYIPTII